MCGVIHDYAVVLVGQVHESRQVTNNARVIHAADSYRAWKLSQQFLDRVWINQSRVRVNVRPQNICSHVREWNVCQQARHGTSYHSVSRLDAGKVVSEPERGGSRVYGDILSNPRF